MTLILAVILIIAVACLIVQATGLDDRMDGLDE